MKDESFRLITRHVEPKVEPGKFDALDIKNPKDVFLKFAGKQCGIWGKVRGNRYIKARSSVPSAFQPYVLSSALLHRSDRRDVSLLHTQGSANAATKVAHSRKCHATRSYSSVVKARIYGGFCTREQTKDKIPEIFADLIL